MCCHSFSPSFLQMSRSCYFESESRAPFNDVGPISSVNWTLNGNHIVVGLTSSSVQIWDSTSNHQLRSIGFVISATWYEPFEDTADDISAVDRILAFSVRWFLDPIVLGDYPSEMREGLGWRLPAFDSEMSEKVAGSFDFIGINQYTTLYASASPTPSLDATARFYPDSMVYLTGETQGIPIGEPTGMGGLYVVPRGIQSMVEYVTQTYNRPPIIITESDYVESKDSFATLQEAFEDVRRIHFHSENLNHLAKAIRNGSDVRGYFMWSLLDNFEWQFGYTMRYTSFSELYPLLAAGTLPLVKVQEISQKFDSETLTVENSVQFAGPLATTSFSTNATFEVRSPKRVQIKFEEGIISTPQIIDSLEIPENVEFLGQKIDLTPFKGVLSSVQDAASSVARTISERPPIKFPIRAGKAQSWLLTTYLDEDLRISRADGSSVFVLIKEGSPLLPPS